MPRRSNHDGRLEACPATGLIQSSRRRPPPCGQDAGKNYFESFKGEHIRFTEAELYGWLDKYFV